MLKYHSTYSNNIGINDKNATAVILYSAEFCQNNNTARADKAIQRAKRKIIISTQTGLFWNSEVSQFEQFLKTISEPLNMQLLIDSLLELKRVYIEKAKESTFVLIKRIRDFCFFERDREVVSDTAHEFLVNGSAEKADLKLLIDKFNVFLDHDRTFILDLEHYCTTIVTQKLYEIASACTNDRSLEKLSTKIITVDNLLNQLDKLDDDYNSLSRVTFVFK